MNEGDRHNKHRKKQTLNEKGITREVRTHEKHSWHE